MITAGHGSVGQEMPADRPGPSSAAGLPDWLVSALADAELEWIAAALVDNDADWLDHLVGALARRAPDPAEAVLDLLLGVEALSPWVGPFEIVSLARQISGLGWGRICMIAEVEAGWTRYQLVGALRAAGLNRRDRNRALGAA